MARTGIAFLVAPLVSAAAIVHDAGPLIAGVYAYVISYFFGIPLFLILRRKKKESYLCYAAGGAASAALVALPIVIGSGVWPFMAILAGIGAIEGLCFRSIRGPRISGPKDAATA
ncbi:MAG: hypothetical protein JSS11_13685 [Verrucomicrobia bacterium]|nr:hypothetical protein [Verrucomicrobiota bacterium]